MYVLTADYTQPNASEIFVKSIKETGFGVLKNHPINFQLIQDVYKEWESFFNSELKNDYLFDKEKQDGFFPYLSENAKDSALKDLKEFYHLYTWGRYPKTLSHKTRDLFGQMSSLAATLLEWIEKHTPIEIKSKFSMPLSDMIQDSPRTTMRILHYPPLTGHEAPGSIRAAAHEDIDLLTVLPTSTTTGLQVKDTHGNWHNVESDPGTMVVNAGDMLQMCSGNYYRSTTHQVINPKGEDRMKPRLSMPLFLHPKDDVLLSSEHTAKSYLIQRLKEIGVM
jgi:isopenicillin N synthase-like dioxygenase